MMRIVPIVMGLYGLCAYVSGVLGASSTRPQAKSRSPSSELVRTDTALSGIRCLVWCLRNAALLEKYRSCRVIALWISSTGGLAGAVLGFAGA